MIEFQTQNVEMPQIDVELVRTWIGEVAARHGKTVGPLTSCFCADPHIIEVNRQFLQHDFYTDIITFDYTRRNRISGDMLISLDTVASNAEMLGMAYDQELHRVIIHGVLHLCGIDDKGEGEREIMEAYEDDALSIFQRLKQSES